MSALESNSRSRQDHQRRRSRSRSPRRETGHHHRRHIRGEGRARHKHEPAVRLPFAAKALTKYDLGSFRQLFATYLDVQKEILVEDLDEHELRGRWKSFMNKWNRGELSEGWYDPQTKARAESRAQEIDRAYHGSEDNVAGSADRAEDEDDGYGPALPRSGVKSAAQPNRQDLKYRDELEEDARYDALSEQQYQRKQDRRLQKERLDDLAPRAEPGTKERQLEKKREQAESNRAFREARSPGAEEVREGDLMGDDGAEGYKARLQASERRKTERELRKEELLRARAAEREERLSQHRAKEDKTMEMLKAIAKQRFG
ncbi:hypothetical protein K461DRAFT_115008 [Myriangium duriaei CBS 260.36]|uniref:Uncharacterized protein n=1 Tax=Myriangium duriaei CBS 260.36 TaxID=1168546 RepID=A0A9P4J3A2_9PEZI|nr:hypothetical protein K461DRAFT_115008 [Myriangium duriaei CBS 260.36]